VVEAAGVEPAARGHTAASPILAADHLQESVAIGLKLRGADALHGPEAVEGTGPRGASDSGVVSWKTT
jgi:hypothetical protein